VSGEQLLQNSPPSTPGTTRPDSRRSWGRCGRRTQPAGVGGLGWRAEGAVLAHHLQRNLV